MGGFFSRWPSCSSGSASPAGAVARSPGGAVGRALASCLPRPSPPAQPARSLSCSPGSEGASEGGAARGPHGETCSPDACFRVRGLRCVCPQQRSPSPAGPAHREPVPSLRSGCRQRVAAGAAFGGCKRASASANAARACSVPALDLAGAPSAHPWFQSDVNGQTGRAGGADSFRCSAQVKVGTPHRWGTQASARGTLGGTGGAEAFLNTVVSKISLRGANPPAGHLRSLGGPCPVAFAASRIYHRAVPLLGTCPECCARAVAHGRAPLPPPPSPRSVPLCWGRCSAREFPLRGGRIRPRCTLQSWRRRCGRAGSLRALVTRWVDGASLAPARPPGVGRRVRPWWGGSRGASSTRRWLLPLGLLLGGF